MQCACTYRNFEQKFYLLPMHGAILHTPVESLMKRHMDGIETHLNCSKRALGKYVMMVYFVVDT